jgi:hypothetical protein
MYMWFGDEQRAFEPTTAPRSLYVHQEKTFQIERANTAAIETAKAIHVHKVLPRKNEY